jgi:hypothetical protein
MKENKFEFLFRQLGIKAQRLPGNYTPDSFAQKLMANIPRSSGVSYSTQTDYGTDNNKNK